MHETVDYLLLARREALMIDSALPLEFRHVRRRIQCNMQTDQQFMNMHPESWASRLSGSAANSLSAETCESG
jgi:hypothetical protein